MKPLVQLTWQAPQNQREHDNIKKRIVSVNNKVESKNNLKCKLVRYE